MDPLGKQIRRAAHDIGLDNHMTNDYSVISTSTEIFELLKKKKNRITVSE